MRTRTLNQLIDGLEKIGVRVKRINPTHVAELYKGKNYLGKITKKRGVHAVNWGKKAKILPYQDIVRFIARSGYDINF